MLNFEEHIKQYSNRYTDFSLKSSVDWKGQAIKKTFNILGHDQPTGKIEQRDMNWRANEIGPAGTADESRMFLDTRDSFP